MLPTKSLNSWAVGHKPMCAAAALLAALMGVAVVSPVAAEEADAKAIFKTMSDFLVGQKAMSVDYDATLEIVTADMQKVGFASSGALTVNRPDKVRVSRTGGFADVELVYDGKTLSAYGKNLNIYAKRPTAGTIDELIDVLRDDFGLEVPAADLLSSNPYEIMMSNVAGGQDLGSGVIRGKICDHLAFRTADVDWQLWVAQGDKPFPCRFTITSRMTALAPSYSIEFTGWKSGQEVAADDFQLKTAADAKEVGVTDLKGFDDVPSIAAEGDAQ
jgi:hypothetical protein